MNLDYSYRQLSSKSDQREHTRTSLLEQTRIDTGGKMQLRRILGTAFVEPVMFVYMICLYYLIPALNSLYLYKVCRTVHNYDKSLCEDLVAAKISPNFTEAEHAVSQDTSKWLFYQTVLFTVPSTVVTLLMGIYGDRHGRRLPLILPLCGQALGAGYYLLMASLENANIAFLLVGPFITGISGGFATVIMATFSHLAAASSDKYRTVRLVILQAVMGVGTMLGSFTVGKVVDQSHDPLTGWISAFSIIIALSVLCIIYVLIASQFIDVLPTEHYDNSEITWRDRCTYSFGLRRVLSTVCENFPSLLQLTLLAIWFIWVTGLGEFDVMYSYTQRTGLDRTVYGYYAGYGAGVQAVAGIVSVLVLKRILGVEDTTLALMGLVAATFEQLFLGFTGFFENGKTTGFLVFWWMSPLVGMFKIMGPTALRSIASNKVAKCDQSKLFAFISGSDGLLQLATSGLYQYLLWPATEKEYPNMSFFLSAALTLVSFGLTLIIKFKSKPESSVDDRDDEDDLISS